jgi:dolichyl-phosphate beta-glucosyltransferase
MTDTPHQPTAAERAHIELYRDWAERPIEGEPEISIVIPAYNEEFRILPTIGAIAVEISKRNVAWELIVSDDGSKDSTRSLVQELGLPNLRLLLSPNTGKGGAVRRGMLAARGRYVLFADADQSTPIEQFGALLAQITDGGADVVIGSRGAEGAEVAHKSLLRKVMSAGLNLIVRVGFRLPIADTQCGFKLLTREAAQRLFRLQRIDGFSFDLEVLFLARKHKLKIAEVPVEWIDAPGSTVDPGKVAVQFLKDLVRIRLWSLKGLYRTSRHFPPTPEFTAAPKDRS